MLSSNSSAFNPRVAVYDNNVYVVWTDNSSKGNSDIIFRKSADKGATFDAAENLSNNPGNSTDPLITAYRNHVYVVWTDNTRGNNDIDFKVSHDYGNNFSRTKPVSRNNGSSVLPQLAATGNNVYVVWTDDTTGNADINFRKSSDYGNNFNRTTNLSRNNVSSVSPQLAATGNNVYVVWTNDTTGNADINFRKSSDYGNKFAGDKNLSENITSSSFDPKIAALDREKIHITWIVGTDNESEIFFTASGDTGEHFDNALNLSRSTLVSGSLYMAAYQKDLYLVWTETDGSGRGGETIFKRVSEVFFPRNAK